MKLIKKTLPNGIRLVGYSMPFMQSVSLGIWVGTGTAKENKEQAGISHLIEHMLFKGTTTRTAKQIAIEMDSIGAHMNAFTAKEYTCYYTKSTREHLEKSVDILSDMIKHATLDDLDMEKDVVIEEILMTEDNPDDVAMEALAQIYFEGNSLALPILGTKESVSSFTKQDIHAYMAQHYTSDNMVVAVAGNFDEEIFYELAEKYFLDIPKGNSIPFVSDPLFFPKTTCFKEKDIEQLQICLASPGFSTNDSRYYDLMLLSNAWGGSMSSRLFQKIREEKGLAYSVSSFIEGHVHTGVFYCYAGCSEDNAEEVVSIFFDELQTLREAGLTKEEFKNNKEQLKGNFLLASESTSSRMMSLGRNMVLYNKAYTIEETFHQLAAISMDSVQAILPIVTNRQAISGAFVGRVAEQKDQLQAYWT